MKKLLFIFTFCLSFAVYGQPGWYHGFDTAKTAAKNSGRLMVIDFRTDWCKPCIIMDEKLWNSPIIEIQYENFVRVKIDVDKDKRTPERFNVTGIPKIVIALHDGSILWQKTGFSDEQEFVAILNTKPNDVMALYQVYFSVLKLTKDSKCACEIAKQFQQLAGKTENKDLQYALIQKNEEFFKKSLKDNTDQKVTGDIELYLLLNDVYAGKPDKAFKKFNKTYKCVDNCLNQELAHFFLAQYYKAVNDSENFDKEVCMITENEFIAQLEKP